MTRNRTALGFTAFLAGVASLASLASFGLASCTAAPEASTTAASDSATAGASPAASAVPAPNTPLAGTRWRLVEIQSMDDAIGTARPDDPSLYTLAFQADGRLAMRLNCNRGNGPWKATPAADGPSGSLEIGPLAVTRALCPPPSLDERIARDMDFVRGYLVRDGRLSLTLMADGGIYVWEPETEPAE
ncbi:MAG: hypothetical protein QG573_2423 [Acidobacteriota bacterium]|nr:hypothetical protein [Acidobacteriota bacterium]